MFVERLELRDFRSYRSLDLRLDPSLTIIHGPNAAGKTNIIEALQLATEGVSFRSPQWKDVVLWGADRATVTLSAAGDGRQREVEVAFSEGRRNFSVNGKKVRSSADVAGEISCVIFTPNDLRLVKDAADKRRDEIDSLGSQLSKSYSRLRAEYGRIVIQRNRLLKDEVIDHSTLAAWTERLVVVGCSLTHHRARLLERMRPHFVAAAAAIDPSTTLSLSYLCTSAAGGSVELEQSKDAREDAYRSAIELRFTDEISRRLTLVGPHRDDIVFRIDGRDARTFGSQGQQRTISLAWKLAEVKTVREVTGKSPLLLLDDVMSELDESRRRALTDEVGLTAQTVITTANIDYFDSELLGRARVIAIGSGSESGGV